MDCKKEYIEYCNCPDNEIPFFMQPQYLDIVCMKDWDVMRFCRNGEVVAWLPYYIYKQRFFLSLRPTAFMPYQGLVLDKAYKEKHFSPSTSNHAVYHLENEISDYFASQIDSMGLSACFLRFMSDFFCATPFIQHGFDAKVEYTYILDISKDDCFPLFSPAMRKKLRKAEKELHITKKDYDLKEIYTVLNSTYKRQNTVIPYSFELFSQIVTFATQNNQGRMFVSEDESGKICSVLFIVWDKTTAYSLIGGNNNDNMQRDAGAFTQYESIKFARSIGLTTYDFEGSILKGIEEFFQHFGAVRTPYLSLAKYYSKLYRHLRAIKNS